MGWVPWEEQVGDEGAQLDGHDTVGLGKRWLNGPHQGLVRLLFRS